MRVFFKSFGWALSTLIGLNLFNIQPSWAGGAFQLTPAIMEFSPSGGGSTQSFTIKSTGDEPVAIQVDMVKREVSLDGTEINPDANEDFIVYPPQLVIPPGETQTIRVTWVGDPQPSKELAYRIITEQMPINLSTVTSVDAQTGATVNVTVTLRYLASVYIRPQNTSAKVVLESVAHGKGKNNNDQLVINLENQGTMRQLLEGTKITLTSNQGQTVTLSGEQLKGIEGENILAGNKRQFIIPWLQELPVGEVTGTFEINR